MFHIVFFCLVVGQVPPPPPVPQSPSVADQSPPANNPQAQREWLLAYLTERAQAEGKLDATKYRDIEKMVNNVQDSHLGKLVQYYQDRKAQGEAQVEADLRRSQNRELQRKTALSRQEQAQGDMQYRSSRAAQQGQVVYPAQPTPRAIQDIYAVPPWPYYFYRPYYYAPYAGRHRR